MNKIGNEDRITAKVVYDEVSTSKSYLCDEYLWDLRRTYGWCGDFEGLSDIVIEGSNFCTYWLAMAAGDYKTARQHGDIALGLGEETDGDE